eukprot:3208352-Rhodomonas_salina.1
MDTCHEVAGAFWFVVSGALGFSRLDCARDLQQTAVAMIDDSITELTAREADLERAAENTVAQARAAMKEGHRTQAKLGVLRARRLNAQLQRVQNVLANLQAQQDAIESTKLIATLVSAFKNSSAAFTSWKTNAGVQDVAE